MGYNNNSGPGIMQIRGCSILRNMRYVTAFICILLAQAAAAQGTESAEAGLREDYTIARNRIYFIEHSTAAIAAKQDAVYSEMFAFIKKYPAREECLYMIAAAVNLRLAQFDSLISLTDSALNLSPFKASASITRKRIYLTETGRPFPAFSFIDTAGNALTTESMKGRMVLVDCWSSWCSPCRQQIPALKKLYKKYHDKNFEIVGVSMDQDKAAWLKAIAADGQTWPQFCELVSFGANKTASFFSIRGIPANFLLDENGVILGQDLSPDQVKDMLQSR